MRAVGVPSMSDSLSEPTPGPHNRRARFRREADAEHDHLARLLARIPEAILCFDRNWVVTYANAEAARISRVEPADIHNKTHWELFPETLGTDLERAYRGVMESRLPQQIEYFYEPFDVWVDIHILPTDEGVALYYRDITSRKRAELLRDASARQLHEVLETTFDAVVSFNRDWNYTYLNRRAKDLLSVKGDLLGKNLWKEFPESSSEVRDHYYRAMDQGIPRDFEAFYPRPLNRWYAVQCRPYDDGIIVFFRDISVRRESEITLKQQQDLLADIQDTALVATWDVDFATGKVTFGPGSYPVFGHPLAAIPHFGVFKKILVPEFLPVIEACARAAVETGRMIVQEFQVKAGDGRTLWLESRGRAVFLDGKPSRIRGMTIDIGQRKTNEEALVAGEARYRILADLNPGAIWMGAPDGTLLYANQILLDYIGLPYESVMQAGLMPSFHPDDHAPILEAWSRSASTGSEFNMEARMIRARDGQSRWWWLRAQPIRDEAGKILHWLGVAIDIDDSKTFAQQLQQRQEETERQRAELETIYQTAPVGLGLFDPVDFRYLRLNDRLAEIIGLPAEQILGRPITEVAPRGASEIFEQVLATKTMQRRVFEGEFPSRPGEKHFFNVNYSPIFASDGSIRAIATATLDITHQKKAELALIQSEKLAAVGRLASSISHEINNPLESITNLLYLVSVSGELPESLKGYVQTAQDELSRVCQIATQTLRFHRQAVRATNVTAAELVNAVLNLYQGRLVNSSIRVDAAYASSSTILCFENDIRQVLNNLIANAIDAMRQSGGRLIVRAHDATCRVPSSPQERRGIRITIADTGIGMSAVVQSHLFEPFYTTKDLNGTGLGLWISAGIVSRHQGRLSFRSSDHAVHHGTIFSLFLPSAEVP